MKTVPRTSFSAYPDDCKLCLNLLDCACKAVESQNKLAAIRYVQEAKDITLKWDQSSIAGYLTKKLQEIEKKIKDATDA